MHISCTETNTISKQTKARFHMTRHQGVPSGASKLIFKHMVCSMQTVHQSCIKISTISKQTKPSFHLSVLPFPDGDAKRHKDLSWFGQEKALRPAGRSVCIILHLSACTGANTSVI